MLDWKRKYGPVLGQKESNKIDPEVAKAAYDIIKEASLPSDRETVADFFWNDKNMLLSAIVFEKHLYYLNIKITFKFVHQKNTITLKVAKRFSSLSWTQN